ncbi:MAG: hypothetical protein ABR567_00760 [Myxococcales bacterium]
MTPLGKTLAVAAAVAVVVTGTLMLRPRSMPVAHAQLTPSQLAEMQPPSRAEPPKPPPPAPVVQTSSSSEPEDPDFEDGNGS